MKINQLFQQSRWRMALWYSGVMGVVLSLSGWGGYLGSTHACRMAIDHELESVSGTLHDVIESVLQHPGKVELELEKWLPDLCLVGTHCSIQSHTQQHIAGAIHQGKYYVRFLDPSGKLVAFAGLQPEQTQLVSREQKFQNLKDFQGTKYRQLVLSLHTKNHQNWGYLEVGRNLKEFEDYTATLKLILWLGLPLAMVLTAASGWWLAAKAMNPIYQSYQAIQHFMADAAHELRTPLAAIQATVESNLMMPKIAEAEVQDILKIIGNQNQRLSQMVADLLMLCRMDQQLNFPDPLAGQEEQIALNDLVSDIAEELSALALASDINLGFEIKVSQSLEVTGNAEQLYRLLSNLVVNAIQYTPKGGKVMIRLDSPTSEVAVIQVQDTGIGIPPEAQPHIFDRFYRVTHDRSRHSGGCGLGLAIVYAIVQTHRGKIQVQSEPGKGTIFTVRLPLIHSCRLAVQN